MIIIFHGFNNIFYCYGNFCSYNCAKRYLRPQSEDDLAMLQTSSDICVGDDLGEKMQLLELLYHIETNSDIEQPIKIAPSRLSLQMFGGDKTIDEYRSSFKNKNVYDVKIPPILPINHIVDRYETNQNVSKSNLKLYRSKPLPSEKKSICSSMKLIIDN